MSNIDLSLLHTLIKTAAPMDQMIPKGGAITPIKPIAPIVPNVPTQPQTAPVRNHGAPATNPVPSPPVAQTPTELNRFTPQQFWDDRNSFYKNYKDDPANAQKAYQDHAQNTFGPQIENFAKTNNPYGEPFKSGWQGINSYKGVKDATDPNLDNDKQFAQNMFTRGANSYNFKDNTEFGKSMYDAYQTSPEAGNNVAMARAEQLAQNGDWNGLNTLGLGLVAAGNNGQMDMAKAGNDILNKFAPQFEQAKNAGQYDPAAFQKSNNVADFTKGTLSGAGKDPGVLGSVADLAAKAGIGPGGINTQATPAKVVEGYTKAVLDTTDKTMSGFAEKLDKDPHGAGLFDWIKSNPSSLLIPAGLVMMAFGGDWGKALGALALAGGGVGMYQTYQNLTTNKQIPTAMSEIVNGASMADITKKYGGETASGVQSMYLLSKIGFTGVMKDHVKEQHLKMIEQTQGKEVADAVRAQIDASDKAKQEAEAKQQESSGQPAPTKPGEFSWGGLGNYLGQAPVDAYNGLSNMVNGVK